tara:strand:- start:601 stop:846 length:246 start_codon:yes stop_codon:yes gene_type:complete
MNLKTACTFLLIASIITLATNLFTIFQGLNEGWLSFDQFDNLFRFLINLVIPIALIFVSSALGNQQTQISNDISEIRNMLK